MFSNRKTSVIMSSPYLAWALIFIIVPIGMIFSYGLTDTTGAFTFKNIAAIAQPEHAKALWLAVELAVISTLICFSKSWTAIWTARECSRHSASSLIADWIEKDSEMKMISESFWWF